MSAVAFDAEPPHDAVELLERALAYTRGELVAVQEHHRHRATPCLAWDLDALLAHMDDGLDAFTEAAGGKVAIPDDGRGRVPASVRVSSLQQKACALLGVWSAAPPSRLTIGSARLEVGLLVRAAALEITVHGWDVSQATRRCRPIPAALARQLLPIAHSVVDDDDRGRRFGAPLAAHGASDPVDLLLGHLGRNSTGSLV